ncbi:B3 domain-containing protein [Vitis vinifera]|uniref:B3 domain-containing protein n=1 Tax=Vitis vinifera TaxID=29760 RepID=A0A438FMZ7_VITVI|nr:B3 domain-containing protein [Vitis vinifera]
MIRQRMTAGHFVGACLVQKLQNRQTMEKESLKTEDARPHFFKIIHGEDVKRHLRIPPAFMEHLSQEMSNRATLTGPSGSQWRVTVSTDANGTYLQKGWKQFMKENNLGDSEFLTFRYDGNMQFYVKIFDKSGVQRLAALVSGNRTQEGTRVSNGKRAQGRPRKSPVGSLNLP